LLIVRRVTTLLNSRSHNTELATAAQQSQSPKFTVLGTVNLAVRSYAEAAANAEAAGLTNVRVAEPDDVAEVIAWLCTDTWT